MSTILAVDQNRKNLELIAQFLGRAGFETRLVSDLGEFDGLLDGDDDFALALVDVSGFDSRIWPVCQQLDHHGIPLLVVSARESSTIQQESLAHGARGVLVKPLVARELIDLIKRMVKRES